MRLIGVLVAKSFRNRTLKTSAELLQIQLQDINLANLFCVMVYLCSEAGGHWEF